MKKKIFPLYFIVFVFLFSSCIEKELDFDSIKSQNWSADWAIPVVNTSLNLNDIVEDSSGIIHENENGLLYLVYESEELVSVTAAELVDLPDQIKEEEKLFDLPPVLPGISGELPLQFVFPFEFDQEDQRIDNLMFKHGFYSLSISTDVNRDNQKLDVIIPNLIHNIQNEPIHFVMTFDNPSGEVVTRDTLIDLSDYHLIFDDPSTDTNEVYINTLIIFEGDDNQLNNPYFLRLINEFTELEFLSFMGYAGQRSLDFNDTIAVDMFDVNQEGYFSFGEGSVTLDIEIDNSFGVPVELDIETFRAFSEGDDIDSADIYIFGEGNPSLIEVNYPDINQAGTYAHTSVSSDNSNLHEVLEISPTKIVLDILGKLNPNADPAIDNFVLDTSQIRMKLGMQIEMFGSVNGFTIRDTINFDIGDLGDINYMIFGINAENGFPINAQIQVEFVDSLDNILHALVPDDEQLIVAAEVGGGPQYKVIEPSVKITEISMDREEVLKIGETKKIYVTAVLETNENEIVKIYTDYSLGLKLGAIVGINY